LAGQPVMSGGACVFVGSLRTRTNQNALPCA
jgi:hypothetical protein